MTTGIYPRMKKYRKKVGRYYVNLYPYIFDICWCNQCNEIVWGGKRFIQGHHNILLECRLKNSKSHKGFKPTKETKSKISLKNSGEKNGMYGKIPWNKGIPPSQETKDKLSKKLKGYNSGKDSYRYGKPPAKGAGRGKGQYYNSPLQGKIYLRSSYELSYAKYLDSKNIFWYYEIETFDLGDTNYTPDFFLIKEEKFIEIKGYMLPKYQEKINKFLEQYPWDLEILYKEDLIKLGCII